MSIIEDIQRRSAHIHWPQGIVPEQADLFAHNDIVIAAPPGKIWEHLIHATAWPDWYSNASDVTVNAYQQAVRRRRHVRLDHLRRAHPQHRPRIRARGPHRLVRRDRPVAGLPHVAARAARRGNHLRGDGRDRQRPQPEERRRLQSRPHAPRSRPVEHQPQVPLRKHPGLAATERQHPQLAGSRPARPAPGGRTGPWAAPTAARPAARRGRAIRRRSRPGCTGTRGIADAYAGEHAATVAPGARGDVHDLVGACRMSRWSTARRQSDLPGGRPVVRVLPHRPGPTPLIRAPAGATAM